jgi:hypothetical protein
MLQLIERHAVTATLCVPALYGGLLNAAERTDSKRMRTLNLVITAGESLPETLVARHFALNSGAHLVNEYGPTETTVWCTFRRFERPAPVDIGGPAPGARLYILDRRGRLMPDGASGELHVGGTGVALGYLNRLKATAESFVADAFAPTAGARMYRTGDWARWGEGKLRFLGRRDQLVKVRGHRVELSGVTAALLSDPHVEDAAVLLAPDGMSLAAYLVAGPGYDEAALRTRLAEALPPAAIPSTLRLVPQMPRTMHGKVDHEALRAFDAASAVPGQVNRGEPGADSDVTAVVQAAWCAVLGTGPAPLDVNFFDAGGHSLLVPMLQTEIENRAHARLEIIDLFTATTINAQVALITRATDIPGADRGGSADATARAHGVTRASASGQPAQRLATSRTRRMSAAGEDGS